MFSLLSRVCKPSMARSSPSKGKGLDTSTLSSSSAASIPILQNATQDFEAHASVQCQGEERTIAHMAADQAFSGEYQPQRQLLNGDGRLTYREICTASRCKNGVDCIHVAVFTRPAHSHGLGQAAQARAVDGHSIRDAIMQSDRVAATMAQIGSGSQNPSDQANGSVDRARAVANAVGLALDYCEVYDGDAATTIPDFDGFSPAVDFGHGTIDTESADTAGSFDNNGAHNRDNNNGSSALVARPIPINIVAGGAANSFAAAQRVRARLSAVGPTADRSGGPEFILRPGRHMIYKVAFNSVQPEPLARLFVYTGPHSDPLPGFYLFVAGPLHENMRYYEERGPDPRELRNYAWHCPVLSVPAGDLPPSIASVPSIPSGLIASPITFAAGETSSAAGAASSSFDLTPRSVFEYSSDDGEDEDGSDAEIDSDGDDGNSDDLGVSSLIEPIDIPGASPIVFSPPRPAAAVDVAVNSNHWHPGLHITEHTPHGNANGNANVLDGHVSGAGHGEAASNVDALRNLCRSIPAPTAAVERPRDLFCSWEPLYRSSEWADDVIVNAFQSGLGQLEGSLRFEHL